MRPINTVCRSRPFAYPLSRMQCLVFLSLLAGLSACMTTGDKDTLALLNEELPVKIEKDAVVVSARQDVMDNYWAFMNSNPEDSLRVEALTRLADLELEKNEERYQKQLEELTEKQAELDEAQESIELQGVSYDKAIILLENAYRVSKKSKNPNPQIIYRLARAYEQAAQPRKALAALGNLLKDFPGISNRDEIHFRRGELLFQMKNYDEAEDAYTQSMVVNPGSSYYEKSLSKRGWSTYKKGEYQQALYSFLGVIDRKLRGSQGGLGGDESHLSRGDKELLQDVFRATLLCFNELGGGSAVKEYFDRNGHRPYEYRIYKTLGDYLLAKGRVRDAAKAYREFVTVYPDHEQAAIFDMYAIDAYANGGFAKLALKEKASFSGRYRVNGEYWKSLGQVHQEKLAPVLANNIEELARHYHAMGQKNNAAEDYSKSIIWYRQYLKSFPDREKTPELHLLLADLLLETKKYEEAAREYEATAYQYHQQKNADAAYAAIVAYSKAAKIHSGTKKEKMNRLSVASALRFAKTFPAESRAPTVIIKAAEDLFALKKYNQAAAAARVVMDLSAKVPDKFRRSAWLIIAQSDLQSGRFSEAESAYKIALNLTQDKGQRRNMQEGIAAAIYKRGEQLRSAGDVKGALAQFQRIEKEAPESEATRVAVFDSAMSYMQSENWTDAISSLLKFRNKYPHSNLQTKVSQNLAVAYEKTKQPLLAAKEYENLMASDISKDKQRDMLLRVTELYEEANESGKVVELYLEYIKNYPKPVDTSIEVKQKLAKYHQSKGHTDKYHYWLREIIQADEFAGRERSDRTKFLAAKASFILARPALKSFQNVSLVAPLKANLTLKKKRMQTAVEAYTQAANYGVEEVTTASVYLLGEIYNKFGQELMKSERPPGLSQDELEQYDILLEEQVYPFEEKSIDIHESNATRAVEGTYDEWVKKSFIALRTLRPVRYAKRERSELFADINN